MNRIGIVGGVRCLTFDKDAQDALPDRIKAKMKADRDKSRAEQTLICESCGWPADKLSADGLCEMCASFGERESID